MLPLDKQVCSLEYAKRLLELGVTQESIFAWEYYDESCYAVKFIPYAIFPIEHNGWKLYAAFTVSELLHLLPHSITLKEGEPFNYFRLMITNLYACDENDINKLTRNFIINYECDSVDADSYCIRPLLTNNIYDENPANMAAKMLIFLLENNIIKVEDINK